MNANPKRDVNAGFSLIEIMIALAITMIVMTSVFLLLNKGQDSFRREPEVSDMNANARFGIDRISHDLTVAGYNTSGNMAIMWFDGGGITPDEVTIIYADPEIPMSRSKPCAPTGGGPCKTIGTSSVLNIDAESFFPMPGDFEQAYREGMTLVAIQGPNGDPACDNVAPGIVPFELTQPPKCTGAGGKNSGPAGCATLNLNHNPGKGASDVNLPQGFNNDVSVDCAIIGLFHIIQYRINPLPPAVSPLLERRDLAFAEPWTPISANIENLQVQYVQGVAAGDNFEDVPSLLPVGADPNTWITRVRFTVAGRSDSTNLQGGSQGVFAATDTHLRRSFTTTMSLRNQLNQAQQKAFDLGLDGYN